MLLFAAASLACALASSATAIIIARAFQGLGAGLMQPASTAIVIGAYPEGKRGRAMATYFGVALLFLMAGPVIGGLVLAITDWPWIFLLNLPVAAAALCLSTGWVVHYVCIPSEWNPADKPSRQLVRPSRGGRACPRGPGR